MINPYFSRETPERKYRLPIVTVNFGHFAANSICRFLRWCIRAMLSRVLSNKHTKHVFVFAERFPVAARRCFARNTWERRNDLEVKRCSEDVCSVQIAHTHTHTKLLKQIPISSTGFFEKKTTNGCNNREEEQKKRYCFSNI